MDDREIYGEIELQDCPFCAGAALLEEENGWCWYVACADCGAQTAPVEMRGDDRTDAARRAAELWNMGKIIRMGVGE